MLHHAWDITPQEAIALQRELAGRVRIEPLARDIHTIAGADCAFVGRGKSTSHALAAAVLCDARTLEVIAFAEAVVPCRFPYIPGLLSFREAPAVIAAVGNLPASPDMLMCDGQGLAHPRGIGLASHVGLLLNLPTIGVAKSRLCGRHSTPGDRRGCRRQLRFDGKVVGSVVRTRTGVRPLFVSVGHRITLDEAVRWTLRCAVATRLPEPTRRAHQLVTQLKSK